MHTPTVLLDINAVKKQTGYKSTQSIYNKMAGGDFPPSISCGGRTRRWIAAEVEAWVQARIAESRIDARQQKAGGENDQ